MPPKRREPDTSPPVERWHDCEAARYDARYRDIPYWRLYNELTWRTIESCLPSREGAAVLDAGGGTGLWTVRLAERGYKVTLVDISAGMLEVAKRKVADKGLSSLVDIRKMERPGIKRQDITMKQIPNSIAFQQFIHRPSHGLVTAADEYNRVFISPAQKVSLV